MGKGNREDPGDGEAALRAAQLARSAGISINTYALGPTALQYPRVVTEMARMTVGNYTPVQNPGDIVTLLQGVTFADVEDVVLTNLSTGEFSTDVRLAPDGSFTGFVPVREGRNRVRISALASDGSRGSVELEFDFEHNQVGRPHPPRRARAHPRAEQAARAASPRDRDRAVPPASRKSGWRSRPRRRRAEALSRRTRAASASGR